MSGLIESALTGVPAWVVYGAVFALPFLEASVFLGFVIPGETALVFGGVLAGRGQVGLVPVLALAILGAVLGDAVGYGVGRRFGPGLQASRLGQKVGERRWRTTEEFLQRRGGPAVLLGRFTALLRALVPSAAGMARLPYRTFALWNAVGGSLWAGACVLGGYALGDAIGSYLTSGGYVLVAVVLLVVVVHLVRSRRSRRRAAAQPAPAEVTSDLSAR